MLTVSLVNHIAYFYRCKPCKLIKSDCVTRFSKLHSFLVDDLVTHFMTANKEANILSTLRRSIVNRLIETNATRTVKVSKIKKGGILFKEGEAFDHIYVIFSGSVKTYTTTLSGNEKITCFFHQDDILGFSGIDAGTYPVSARALETTHVCRIMFSDIETLSLKDPELQRSIFKLMSRQIHENQKLLSLLGKTQSEKRVASFLLNLYYQRHALSSEIQHKLTMSRKDIGNYLGITEETVSRSITKLSKSGFISISGKTFSIIDTQKLVEFIDGYVK
ncbi:helix-turn-helix domain-containing protein [Marinomonas sp. A79]|uniref:Helix-turn-helix domain-containing protein n=1 Tax=Marinomonas vulgaris TaxID=2823372 RepID=A0ABS5H8J5_9GAMM|nr:helix-turn-helix domain-containing protein [Marinomonas vulgaris]MBR7887915.1 helix-turn-helix domain-containing protein [Marinomonas vulgaris]